MKEALLFPVIVVAGLALLIAMAVLWVVLTVVSVADFVLNGHEPTSGGTCDICGKPIMSAPTHRWQVLAYLRWLFQHSHSFRDR